MITPPKPSSAPDIKRNPVLDWSVGTVTDYNARRIVSNALATSKNVMLEQNGVVRPRPSLKKYGPQPVGTILGEIYECKTMSNGVATFYLICVQNVNGVAKAYYAKGEDETWTAIGEKTFNTTARCHFLMVANKVLIMNGEDNLCYIDPYKWTITTYASITDPTAAPTGVVDSSLTGTSFKIYYAVSANSTVGETAVSPVLTKDISTQRDMWKDAQNVTISWSAVTGATGYNVYMGVTSDGAGQAKLYTIAENLDAAVLTFKDNGSHAQNLMHPSNAYNSTAGPKVTRGAVVNGRVWLTGDKDNTYYIWYGGDTGFELDFSPSNGGGWTTVASGTKEVPVSIKPFRRGTGDNSIVVLTQGSNGSGRRYHISPSTVTYGNASFVMWSTSEDGGAEGTDSPDGVVFYNNSLYYPSRNGFRTTGTMPQLQNVLSTTDISATIRDKIDLLNTAALDKAVGLAWGNKIYWALPVGSDHNNRVWVFDIGHKGAWLLSWHLNIDWMTMYNDNSGHTHFIMVSDNKIYELSRDLSTTDDGTAFPVEISSGDIQWDKDGREWARLIQVVFTFLKPTGEIDISVTAHTEDGDTTYRQHLSAPSPNTAEGWSEVGSAPNTSSWSESTYKSSEDSSIAEYADVIVEIDEDVQWYSYKITSTGKGVDYSTNSIVAEYVPIGIKDLS